MAVFQENNFIKNQGHQQNATGYALCRWGNKMKIYFCGKKEMLSYAIATTTGRPHLSQRFAYIWYLVHLHACLFNDTRN